MYSEVFIRVVKGIALVWVSLMLMWATHSSGGDKPKGCKQHSSGKLKFPSSQTDAHPASVSSNEVRRPKGPKATDAKPSAEISSLNLCRGAKEENCKLTDANAPRRRAYVDVAVVPRNADAKYCANKRPWWVFVTCGVWVFDFVYMPIDAVYLHGRNIAFIFASSIDDNASFGCTPKKNY